MINSFYSNKSFYSVSQLNRLEFKNSKNLSTFVTKVEDKNSKIFNLFDIKDNEYLFDLEAKSDWFPDGVIGDNITGYLKFIVTNIVHYLSFKSVFNVQKPYKVMIHCNCDKLEGNYWNRLKNEFKDSTIKLL